MLGIKVPDKFIGKPFIYFITEVPFNNWYKIGLTQSKTSDRIKNLQTGSSAELTHDFIIPVCKTIKLSSVEHLFHEFYATVRKSLDGKFTEWFKLTVAEARMSNDAFIYYKNLYLVDKIVDLDCFREILFTWANLNLEPARLQKTNNKPLQINKPMLYALNQKMSVCKSPILIDLTDDDSTMPIQKKDNRSNNQIAVSMIIDIPQKIDIAQEIDNMTAKMKYLSLV